MKNANSFSTYAIFAFLLAGCCILFFASLLLGSNLIKPAELFDAIKTSSADNPTAQILLLFRLPKAIAALLAGAALGVSGLCMQSLFRNPLAGPSVMGINSGAGLGTAIIMLIPGIQTVSSLLNQASTATAAFGGALLVLIPVLILAQRVRNISTVLIIGLLASFAINAGTGIMMQFASAQQLQRYISWGFGSFAAVSPENLAIMAPVVILSVVFALFLIKSLNALQTGEEHARSLGINLQKSRLAIILLVSVSAATVTAFCGPISFFGIAIPHLARGLFRTSNHSKLIPGSALLGANIAIAADIIAQLPGLPTVLPLNAVSSLIGAPIVVIVLLRSLYGNKQQRSTKNDSSFKTSFTERALAQKESLSLQAELLDVGFPASNHQKAQNILLRSINLSLEPGQLVALVGPNGSGKSSLLRTLAGLQNPLAGKIQLTRHTLDGHSGLGQAQQISALSPGQRARVITAVFTPRSSSPQSPLFGDNMSVFAFTALGRTPYLPWHGKLKPADRQSIQQGLELAGIDHLSDAPIGSLSDGELQRALIARAIAQDTSIILLDEPTAHLDMNAGSEITRLLYNICQNSNRSILYSTHNLGLADKHAHIIAAVHAEGLHLFPRGRKRLETTSAFLGLAG